MPEINSKNVKNLKSPLCQVNLNKQWQKIKA